MSCCGQKRAEAQTSHAGWQSNATKPNRFASSDDVTRMPSGSPPRPEASHLSPPLAPVGTVPLRYLANASIVVRGPISHKEYRFSGREPVQRVARADVDHLVATGYFRREG